MQSMPSDMGELLAAAEAAHGGIGDACSVAHLLKACEPSLLLLADAEGEVIFADDFDSETNLEFARALAVRLVGELSQERACRLEWTTDTGCRVAFAVRLPDWAGAGIAGCLARPPGLSGALPTQFETARVVCATLGWAACHTTSRNRRLGTRVAHLQAEHETLKSAQAQAVAAAIEEREQRMQRQQLDMARLEALMKLAADGIVTVNEAGIVESFNDAAGRMFGYDPKQVIGRHVSMLAPVSECGRRREHVAKYLARTDACVPCAPHEVVGQRKDGTLFPLEIAVSEVPLDSGRVLTGILRDTAERRRLESQLVQARKMESVGQLAAGIAHEINTPTQYVGDNTRFLEDAFRDLATLLDKCNQLSKAAEEGKVLGPLAADVVVAAKEADLEYLIDEIPKAIGQSLAGVERVAKIVRSMNDFSPPGGETKQAVDLNRALQSTLTVCRNEWKYVAEAVTELDPGLPLVTCLPGECNQVFLNLIINAAHAIGDKLAGTSTEKGTITVATGRDGDWVEIRIGDTGAGIPVEARSRIFDPFFTTKEVGRGTGQGLAIAHAVITEQHGGTINFETEIGRGTTFIVRLPIAEKSSSSKGKESEEAHSDC